MEMHSSYINRSGQRLKTRYQDIEPTEDLDQIPINSVQAFCFHAGKLVVVYSEQKGYWGPPGGGAEAGESAEEATIREILEETNMRVLTYKPLGMLTVYEPDRTVVHARSLCVVEPIGPFLTDPDGDVTEIRLIDPADYKEYFDWGEVGEYQMSRALEMYAGINRSDSVVKDVEEAGRP